MTQQLDQLDMPERLRNLLTRLEFKTLEEVAAHVEKEDEWWWKREPGFGHKTITDLSNLLKAHGFKAVTWRRDEERRDKEKEAKRRAKLKKLTIPQLLPLVNDALKKLGDEPMTLDMLEAVSKTRIIDWLEVVSLWDTPEGKIDETIKEEVERDKPRRPLNTLIASTYSSKLLVSIIKKHVSNSKPLLKELMETFADQGGLQEVLHRELKKPYTKPKPAVKKEEDAALERTSIQIACEHWRDELKRMGYRFEKRDEKFEFWRKADRHPVKIVLNTGVIYW